MNRNQRVSFLKKPRPRTSFLDHVLPDIPLKHMEIVDVRLSANGKNMLVEIKQTHNPSIENSTFTIFIDAIDYHSVVFYGN
jgi:hypothetical protein